MSFEHLARPVVRAWPGSTDAPTILCVDDDPAQRMFLAEHLEAAGYRVVAVADGSGAAAALVDTTPHAILLDLGLPDIDGVELCHRLVEWPACPVIVVSADLREHRMVEALDAGAVDYVTKPFSPAVLEARLRVALRERDPARRIVSGDVLRVGDVVLDAGSHEVTVGGVVTHLHARPFALLEQLMRHEGLLLPYAVLVGKHRGDALSEPETQALRIAISRVRKALGAGPERAQVLTEPRAGYRLVGPA
ncbi:MAG TPA: response regulator transcription factor [Ilumatobacter sp.]|nr:response regulator transcription factor [Ilumatobacter sp.]